MDIVADVLKQADPAKLKIATRQIEEFARQRDCKICKDQFQLVSSFDEINRTAPLKNVHFRKDQSRVPGGTEDGLASQLETRDTARKAAMKGLETVLATKMIEGMMPKDQSRLYGEGTAGEIWRGLHIEAMGKALASQGLFATSKGESTSVDQLNEKSKKTKLIVPFAG